MTAAINGTWSLNEKEFFIIQHVKVFDIEELVVQYEATAVSTSKVASKGLKYKKVYQIGTVNFETVNSRELTLSVVQNYQGSEFTIKRFGPTVGKFR